MQESRVQEMLKFQLSIVPALLPLAAVAQTRPNIVLFLVDDMGLMDTSLPFDTDSSGQPVRQPLNQWYNTPNMERLATTGIRFTSFYAQTPWRIIGKGNDTA